MPTQNITVVSIHPDRAGPLALDLKDLLSALGPHLGEWNWCVRNLDWLGEGGEAFCRRVQAEGPAGLWIPSEELVRHAAKIYQTIEGEFLAFPQEVDPKTVQEEELNLRAFPASRADLALQAVDGCFFEIFTKDPEVLNALKKFKDLREENPTNYF